MTMKKVRHQNIDQAIEQEKREALIKVLLSPFYKFSPGENL